MWVLLQMGCFFGETAPGSGWLSSGDVEDVEPEEDEEKGKWALARYSPSQAALWACLGQRGAVL